MISAFGKTMGSSYSSGRVFKPGPHRTLFPVWFGGPQYLALARKNNLPIITEVPDVRDIDRVLKSWHFNLKSNAEFSLLRELSRVKAPILLKRAAATVEEWLLAAEYLMAGAISRSSSVNGVRTLKTLASVI